MAEELIFSGVVLVPLIIGLIGIAKRFFPKAHDNVWLGVSLLLGIVSAVAVYVANEGMPGSFQSGLALVVLGLSWGLSASKAYDESKKRIGNNAR